MKTLVLHAPRAKVGVLDHAKKFGAILATKKGPAYAIYAGLVSKIQDGCKVVVVSKDDKRCAEGEL